MKTQFLDLPGLETLVNELKNYISNEKVVEYTSKAEFPSIGKIKTIYIDRSDNMIYRWNDDELKYYSLGFNPDSIEIIDGGNANF